MNQSFGRAGVRNAVCCVIANAWVIAGCSSDARLGFNPNELSGSGTGGSAGVAGAEGGRANAEAGSTAGGTTSIAGETSTTTGGAPTAGAANTGGMSQAAGMGGASEPMTGGAGGSSPRAGAGGVAGSSGSVGSAGEGGEEGTDGVLLTAVLEGGRILAEWHNGTDASIFLRGCSTTDAWYREGGEWKQYGALAVCAIEGPVVEVAPGTTYRDPAGGTPPGRGDNVWRLAGPYGSACSSGARFSAANCATVLEATSVNEITVP